MIMIWLYSFADDTGMFYGMKFFNDLLMEAGPSGNVQSEVLLQKDKDTFTFKQGWAFPRKVYFNGDECMLPPPDSYPYLPSFAHHSSVAVSTLLISLLLLLIIFFWSFLQFCQSLKILKLSKHNLLVYSDHQYILWQNRLGHDSWLCAATNFVCVLEYHTQFQRKIELLGSL